MEKVANPVAEGSNSITHGHHDNGKQASMDQDREHKLQMCKAEIQRLKTIILAGLFQSTPSEENSDVAEIRNKALKLHQLELQAIEALKQMTEMYPDLNILALDFDTAREIMMVYQNRDDFYARVRESALSRQAIRPYMRLMERFAKELQYCVDHKIHPTIKTTEFMQTLIRRVLIIVEDYFVNGLYFKEFPTIINNAVLTKPNLLVSSPDTMKPTDRLILRAMALMGIYYVENINIPITSVGRIVDFNTYYHFVTKYLQDTQDEELLEIEPVYLYCYFAVIMAANNDPRLESVLNRLVDLNDSGHHRLNNFLLRLEAGDFSPQQNR